jgi:type I restriction enzyme S subunit
MNETEQLNSSIHPLAVMIKLSDCIETIIDHRGKTPKKLGSDWVKEGIKVISAKNVHNGSLSNQDEIRFVTNEIYKKWMKEDVKVGDCLLSSEGATFGESLYWDFDFPVVLGQRIFCIRANPKVLDPLYLYVYMKTNSFLGQIEGRSSGTSVFGLKQSELLKVNIPIISLEEQKKIGLTNYYINKKIDLLHRNNKTLEQIAETLFKQLFVEDSENNCIPGRVKDICKLPSGFSFKSNSFIENGIYKIITIKNVQNGYLDLKNTDTINIIPSNFPHHCKLKMGDILLSLTGNVGRVCRVTEENLLLNQRVSKVTPLSKEVYEFCLVLFSSNKFRTNLEELARGTAQSNLSPIETLNIEINVPKSEMLLKFHNLTKELFEKHLNNNLQIHKLENLRDTLLPKLISGSVRVEN